MASLRAAGTPSSSVPDMKGGILNEEEQEAVIDTIVREAAAYYRSIMAGFGSVCAGIALLVICCHFIVATGDAEPIDHAAYLLHHTNSVLPLLVTYFVVASVLICIVAHSVHTFHALSSVRELGTVAQAPWGSIVLGKPPAQYTAIPPMLQAAVPAHAEWVALLGVGYLPCTVYWAAVLVAHELWVVHVWWLACGVPAIVAAYVMGVQCGDSMLRDAAGLAAYKYSLKTA
ncbi:unnamed protein product [Symbiodinium sp. KB8]|nr:unnamed protein product [Symbiodinium sp. KB8]